MGPADIGFTWPCNAYPNKIIDNISCKEQVIIQIFNQLIRYMKKIHFILLVGILLMHSPLFAQILRKPIPDKLVVLTFDDAVSSHATFVAPLLKKYGFGGTFFVCEFPPDFDDKQKYMSWAQMAELDKMGFEVANHTGHHKHVNKLTKEELIQELEYIENKCQELNMKRPVNFAYPAYETHPAALEILKEKNYTFARIGGNRPYDPQTDHPFLIPSFSTTGENKQQILDAIGQAKAGKIVVLTIHGVPDTAHPWVNTPPELFEAYLKYLKDNQYKVIAMRDLIAYIDAARALKEIKPKL
jgi:peptidoglycan-N-acetylglucosamine deacetylase